SPSGVRVDPGRWRRVGPPGPGRDGTGPRGGGRGVGAGMGSRPVLGTGGPSPRTNPASGGVRSGGPPPAGPACGRPSGGGHRTSVRPGALVPRQGSRTLVSPDGRPPLRPAGFSLRLPVGLRRGGASIVEFATRPAGLPGCPGRRERRAPCDGAHASRRAGTIAVHATSARRGAFARP